jgi:hypothetical protein
VTITVTAENGTKKTYSIRVKRAQDPNYVPSSDNHLSELTVEGFALSPVFSPDVKQYYVWLPYEQTSVNILAEAAHSLASVNVGVVPELIPGHGNDIAVTVTAEDGTQQIYTVTAVRAPALADTEDYLGGAREPAPEPETEPPTEPATEPTEPPTEPPSTEPPTDPTREPTQPTAEPTQPDIADSEKSDSFPWLLVVVPVATIAAAALGFLLSKKRK